MCVSFIPFFVFGFRSVLATKLQKYYVIFVYILQGKMGKTEKTERILRNWKDQKIRTVYGMNFELLWGNCTVFLVLCTRDTDSWRINIHLCATCQCLQSPKLEKPCNRPKIIQLNSSKTASEFLKSSQKLAKPLDLFMCCEQEIVLPIKTKTISRW